MLIGAEAERRSLNRDRTGVDDIVVDRDILVGQAIFVQHAVALKGEVVLFAVVYFHRTEISQSAFDAVIDNPGASASGVKSNNRSGSQIGCALNKQSIVIFASGWVICIVAGEEMLFSFGGKREIFI